MSDEIDLVKIRETLDRELPELPTSELVAAIAQRVTLVLMMEVNGGEESVGKMIELAERMGVETGDIPNPETRQRALASVELIADRASVELNLRVPPRYR